MIPVGAIPSYAQYNEDIILLALFWDVKKGFYIDVGANHSTIDSVTKLFYDRGWRGVNIEPIASLYNELEKHRPKDINLHIGVGGAESELEFYENISKPGHSSFKKEEAARDSGDSIQHYKVKIDTLHNIFLKHGHKHTHFLKIDVEGFEKQVIEGNNWKEHRPEVICIESNHQSGAWKRQLTNNDYILFIADGLNSYYVANEAWHRTDGYADRVVNILYKSLKQHHYEAWSEDSKQLKKVTRLNQIHYDMAQAYKDGALVPKDSAGLSLENKSYRERLKITARGLTIDWLRYKKRTKKSRL